MPKALPIIDMSAPVCCAPVAAGPISDEDALQIAMRLKAIADPVRVKILSYLFSSSAGEQISGGSGVSGSAAAAMQNHFGSSPRRCLGGKRR